MPGSIIVSVLGVEDSPSSSRPSSSLSSEPSVSGSFSLKLSMGKTEYQTGGKGDFSFPVRSLRENLKLIFFDAEGNEMSRSEVKVMEVVEKRSWDSSFPLEGIGRVHLKLQFTLNAEEHNRINELREAVLKRKRAELLKSISVGRAADYMGAEKIFMSPLQRVEQLPDFPSKTIKPLPDNFSKEALPLREDKNIFLKSQQIQQLPDFPSKVDIQQPKYLPQEDSPPREQKNTFFPSQENQQSPDFQSQLEDQQPESIPELDSQPEDFPKEIVDQLTFLKSQKIQQLPDSNSEVDSQQQESLQELDLRQPEGLPKADVQLGEKIITILSPVNIQQFPNFPPDIDTQQPTNHQEGEMRMPDNILGKDSPSREKIITVLSSQEIQQIPDFPSVKDVQRPSNHPDADTWQPGNLPEEGSLIREKVITVFPSQEIQQIPDFLREVDAQQPKDFPKENSLQDELQLIMEKPGSTLADDSEKNNKEGNHSVENIENKDLLDNPSTQIEEAIHPQLKVASSSPDTIQETAKPIISKDPGRKKSPASGIKKMISAFESISSPESKSWIRRAERADTSRTPWQERLNNAKFGGILSKSHSTGSLSGLKIQKMNSIPVNAQEEDKHCDVAEIQKNSENIQQNSEPEKNVVTEVIQTKEVVTFHSMVSVTKDVNKPSAAEAEEHSSENSVSSNAKNKNGGNVTVCDYQQSIDHNEIPSRSVVDPDKTEDPCSSIFHSGQVDFTHRLSAEKLSSKTDFLAYFDAEHCLVGSYGNMVPRHICITSGGKQLRDAVGRFYFDG